ncbi:MAG: hypothetical protein KBF36_12060, partial [Chitinophagaceae bacterium]|jgi:hypothetical protein|nr:hypothetical protein [Chitinophagaceae bacterium]
MDTNSIRLLSASDMAVLSQCFAQIRQMVPSSKKLNPKERRSIFKLSENRMEFVEKAIQKMKLNPSLIPAYLDVTAAIKLLHLYNQLNEINTELEKLQQQVENTKLQAGNQALVIAKMFYHQTKNAATLGLQDAKAINDELIELYTVGRNAKVKQNKRNNNAQNTLFDNV